LADIVVGTAFADLWRDVLTPEATSDFGNFVRWFDTLINQPQFVSVLGPLKQAVTEKVAERKAAVGGDAKESKGEKAKADKADKPVKGGEKGGEKPKGGEKKPEAKKEVKKEAPAKKDKADEEKKKAPSKDDDLSHLMDEEPKAEKAKNPLDALPKSPMILDAVKKLFFAQKPYNPNFFTTLFTGSDETTKWDNAGYSVYTCEYKYNDEHTQYFLACNLIGGFLQRVERLRKYGMGAVTLVGASDERPPWVLGGIWIFRGQDIPAEMKECDDSEHFNFTKVDVTTPAGQATFKAYLVDDKIGGVDVLERRYFK